MQGYADQLRASLVDDLFNGEELQVEGADGGAVDINDLLIDGEEELSLAGVEEDLDALQGHEIIRGILEQGRVLKEYARDVDDKLHQTEMDSIQDYIAESDSMVALHEQIKSCDNLLSGMEQLLGKFQSDLGKVSEEIRQLQVQSQTMSTKLKNRRATEVKLGSFIEHLTVSERMVNSILESEVNDDYLEFLMELDKKLKFVHENEEAKMSQATHDLEPALEKLRIRALAKVRDFVLQRIYMLKRPKTNVQIIQQSTLIKQKYFVRFLRQHGQEVYRETRSEYISIVSKIYSAHFRTYLSALEKLVLPGAGQADVLGAPDTGTGGSSVNMMSMFKKDVQRGSTESAFELGERGAVLLGAEQPPIVPHMAEAEGRRLPYELIFRNVHRLLIDTATAEYFFCLDFFEDDTVFRELFTPMVQVVEGDLAVMVQECWDMLTLLLMIRVASELRKTEGPGAGGVPALEEYLDRVHLLLWPRFKLLFDHQLGSIRQGAERTLFVESPAPHYVVRRYAALAASMLLLMAEFEMAESTGMFKAQSFYDMMDRLWTAIFDLLLRMSNMFRDKCTGIIFLIANHNHIRAVLRQADIQGLHGAVSSSGAITTHGASSGAGGASGIGKAGAAALKEAEDQLASCINLYVEEQLGGEFPMLIEFVKKAEQQQKRMGVPEGQPILNFAAQQASPILRDFAARWQHSIEGMHQEVTKQFADLDCGRDVLQASMTALLQYYTRLLELLKKQGPEGQAAVKDAVNVPAIMYEIRKHIQT